MAFLREPAVLAVIAAYLLFTYWAAHSTLYIQGLVLVAAIFGMLAVSLDLVAGIDRPLLARACGPVRDRCLCDDDPVQRSRLEPLLRFLPVCIVGVGVVGLALGRCRCA